MTFLFPSSTYKGFRPVNRDLLCRALGNLDVLHIFSASYGNSIHGMIWVPVSCRARNVEVWVWTQDLDRAASWPQLFSTSSLWQRLSSSITTFLPQMALPSSIGSMATCLISVFASSDESNKRHHLQSTIRRRFCPAHPHARRAAATAGCNLFAYSRAGPVVNSKKTEVLHLPSDPSPPPTFSLVGINMVSLNSSRTWEVSLPPHVTSLWRFNVVLTYRPPPSGGCPSACLRSVTFPHAPTWPFTMPSASRYSSMPARDGHRTVDTSMPSRLFTFGVFKLPCTCTGGVKYKSRISRTPYPPVWGAHCHRGPKFSPVTT